MSWQQMAAVCVDFAQTALLFGLVAVLIYVVRQGMSLVRREIVSALDIIGGMDKRQRELEARMDMLEHRKNGQNGGKK